MLQNDPPEIIPSAISTIPTAKYIIERREKEKLEIHTVRTESYEFLRKEEGTPPRRGLISASSSVSERPAALPSAPIVIVIILIDARLSC